MVDFWVSLSIFIGTPMEPANGKWWPINDEEEREAVKAHVATMDEYLVSDVCVEHEFVLECSVPSEHSVDEYLELSEFLEEIDFEDDMVKALILLNEEGSYYLKSGFRYSLDDSRLYESWDDIVEDYVDNCLLYDVRDSQTKNLINMYLDEDRIKRDLEINGTYHSNGDYVLEVY